MARVIQQMGRRHPEELRSVEARHDQGQSEKGISSTQVHSLRNRKEKRIQEMKKNPGRKERRNLARARKRKEAKETMKYNERMQKRGKKDGKDSRN